MIASKSERLVNLVILLLVANTYVSKARIREAIGEYREAPTDDAFEKKFERDKDELRALGIPIEVGSADKYFEDEQGYRIVRDAFELPEIDLAPDEVAVLGLAARVWQHAGLARSTSSALLKLRAAGHRVEVDALGGVEPVSPSDDEAFGPMVDATVSRTPVRFGYRKAGGLEVEQRHLRPWGVVTARAHWYVVGLDTDRGAPRMFRLSRVVGAVEADGAAGCYVVPEGTDVLELSRSLAPPPVSEEATVLARTGAAQGLRRWAEEVEPGVRPGWDRLRVRHRGAEQLADTVLAHGDTVVVESPPALREEVRRRLAGLAVPSAGAR
ncbi:MAG: helix-turn-helix transcriptional regulator [Marmoricola sp.]